MLTTFCARYLLFLTLLCVLPSLAFAHVRLTAPLARNNNAGIKSGPCGGVPRTASPAIWTVGQQVTLGWQETINHPGKFLFSISQANDVGFQQYLVVPDNQNGGLFSQTFTVPNTPCENCTFQLIQSMEEDPNNPEFYYSCADIRIVAAGGPTPPPPSPTPPPDDGGQSSLSSNSGRQPEFGGYGCGSIGVNPPGGPGAGNMVFPFALLLLTLMTYARLRTAEVKVRAKKSWQSSFGDGRR